MKTFTVDIVADSINPDGQRITSFLLTYPRFIHSELMTHRVFSRNAASSRAIPIEKVMEQVRTNPAMPIRWGKNGKGMQDHGVFPNNTVPLCQHAWREAARQAVRAAELMDDIGLHKQIVNRILEPFVWMTTLVTATEWQNFFALRVHRDAQPEFQHLAYLMLKGYVQSIPKVKDWGEWHVPFGDRLPEGMAPDGPDAIKLAVARAAWTSYDNVNKDAPADAFFRTYEKLSTDGHWSPFEHPAMAERGRHGNFTGWKSHRKFFPSENRTCDLEQHLRDYEAQAGQARLQQYEQLSK